MKELISINMNENGVQTVSARDLYNGLEISDRFNRWFESLLKYGFEKDIDFTSVKTSTLVNNGAKIKLDDYVISIDMAKEICMIQRSDIGRKFRQYFIECENKLKKVVETRKNSNSISDNQFKLESAKLLREIGLEYQGQSQTYKQILDAHATKILTGKFLLPLPETEHGETYSATEVGIEVAKILQFDKPVSAMMIGRCAAKCNLKREGIDGQLYHDMNHGHECDSFRYYKKTIAEIAEVYCEWYEHRNEK